MSGIMLACVAAVGGSSGTGGDVALFDQYISDSVSVGTASAGIQLTNAGATNALTSIGSYGLEAWLTPGIGMSSYEVLATLLSGTLTSGTTGSWLSLGTTRAWQLDNAAAITVEYTSINLAIRLIGTEVILASGNVTLGASVGIVIP